MKEIFVLVSENVQVKLPSMPNFLQAKIGNAKPATIGVEDLTEEQLSNVISAWTIELKKHAKKRKTNKVT